MLRRLTRLLVIAFVLFGTAAPALACAAMLAQQDCCPEGSTNPCGGESPGFNSDGALAICCASVAQGSTASISTSRTQVEQPDHSASPGPVLAVAWLATFTSLPSVSGISEHSVARLSNDGPLTYLRTGRLRL